MRPRIVGDVAKSEERSTEDQAEQRYCEKGVEAGKGDLEEGWKRRPAQDEGEHKPDVVDLPDGRHRVVDQRPCLATSRARSRQEVPDPSSKVDAAGGAVRG